MKKYVAASMLALAFAGMPVSGAYGQSVAPAVVAPAEAAAPSLTAEDAALLKQFAAFEASLTKRTGDVPVPGAHATLHLGDKYYFLGADDSKRVITEAWGNPPSAAEGVIGLVMPAGESFMDTWGAVITYMPDGYVSDKDAADIDPAKLLSQMREGEAADNEERKKQGYPTLTTVGWAEPPSYHPAGHYAIWARELHAGDDPANGLNYDIRLLGRSGVLSINLIDSMSHLEDIRSAATGLIATTSFDAGARYTDYVDGKDQKAEYGIAGLVAAGLGLAAAKKFGLLAILLIALKKGGVVILAALAGLGAWFKKLFGKKEEDAA